MKHFIYTIELSNNDKGCAVRVYRIKKNKPSLVGEKVIALEIGCMKILRLSKKVALNILNEGKMIGNRDFLLLNKSSETFQQTGSVSLQLLEL